MLKLMILSALLWPCAAQAQRVLGDADVAPVSYGPRSSEVRGLMARGEWARAAAAAQGDAPLVKFGRAWMWVRAGGGAQAEAALALTRDLDAALPALTGDLARLRAEALLALQRPAEAAAAVAAQSTPEALRLRARGLREGGALDEARALYTRALEADADGRPVARLGLARVEVAAQRPAEALAHLKALDLEAPALPTAEAGRALAAEVIKAHPKLASRFEERTAEERLARAERLLEAHRNTEAAEALEGMRGAKLDAAQMCRHRYALGRAYRKARAWAKAREPMDEAVVACARSQHAHAPWTLYQQAQIRERLNDEAGSAEAYTQLRRVHARHSLADDAGFFLVRHALDDVGGSKGWAQARALAEAMVRETPEGDMVHEAVFFVALAALVESRWDDARAVLALNARLPLTGYRDHEAGRSAYWQARVDAAQGRLDAARDGLVGVMSSWPFQWYALMAYSELHRLKGAGPQFAREALRGALRTDEALPGLPGGGGAAWAFEVPASVDSVALERALSFVRLGLAEPAQRALDALFDQEDNGDLWLESWLLDRGGAVRVSHDVLRRRLPFFRRFGPVGPGRRLWTLAYPNPFGDLVVPAAKANGLEPALLWGIMREESGFNAQVESWANAVGLLQLILPTAERMATAAERPVTRARLTDPALNVTLGARYIAHVLKAGGGARALPVMPAGYNAGEGALTRWLKARGHLPLDLFVETMPFEEARGYTKRVTASYAVYRYLYFGSDALDDAMPVFDAKLPKPR